MTLRHRWLLVLAGAGVIAGAVPLALAIVAVEGHHRGLVAVFGPIIGWAFIGSGLVAWVRRPESRFGALLTAVGFTYCASGLIVATEPWLFTIGLLLIPLPYAVLAHVLLAFPSGRLQTRLDRVVVGLFYLSATALHWAAVLFQDTSGRQGLPENKVLVADELGAVTTLYDIRFLTGLLLIGALAAILVRRWQTTPTAQRPAFAPVLVAGGLVFGLFALWYSANLVGLSEGVTEFLEQARVVALAAVPFAFLGGLLRSRVVQTAAISELVARLGTERHRQEGLRDVLSEALGDPSLELVYWLPDQGHYVDASGRRVDPPPPGSGRASMPVENNGELVAVLVYDASLAEERELVRTIGAAAALALENQRLEAELLARLEDLRTSRARIVESGDAARRRIERDLHDGAQQRLLSTALTLRMARKHLEDQPEETRMLLDCATAELEGALAELRELARGIHPAVLSERGLDSALQGLANRACVPVELTRIPSGRLPPRLEVAAYFVVAEAITNTAKYAMASHASVQVIEEGKHLVVEVSDDGVGGADPERGSGLRGLADRVGALDGRLEVRSEAGRGTTIRATIPCG